MKEEKKNRLKHIGYLKRNKTYRSDTFEKIIDGTIKGSIINEKAEKSPHGKPLTLDKIKVIPKKRVEKEDKDGGSKGE